MRLDLRTNQLSAIEAFSPERHGPLNVTRTHLTEVDPFTDEGVLQSLFGGRPTVLDAYFNPYVRECLSSTMWRDKHRRQVKAIYVGVV